jgi:hypothetical protein
VLESSYLLPEFQPNMDLLRLPISKNPEKIKKRQTPEKKICPLEKTISHEILCARLSKKSKNGDLGPLAYNKIK